MVKREVLEIANNYLNYLWQNNYKFETAYLFGSQAKGNYEKDSDFDLAIVFENLPDRFSMQIQLLMLTTKFDTRLEPHPFDKNDFTQNNPIVAEILKYGIKINKKKLKQ